MGLQVKTDRSEGHPMDYLYLLRCQEVKPPRITVRISDGPRI